MNGRASKNFKKNIKANEQTIAYRCHAPPRHRTQRVFLYTSCPLNSNTSEPHEGHAWVTFFKPISEQLNFRLRIHKNVSYGRLFIWV